MQRPDEFAVAGKRGVELGSLRLCCIVKRHNRVDFWTATVERCDALQVQVYEFACRHCARAQRVLDRCDSCFFYFKSHDQNLAVSVSTAETFVRRGAKASNTLPARPPNFAYPDVI